MFTVFVFGAVLGGLIVWCFIGSSLFEILGALSGALNDILICGFTFFYLLEPLEQLSVVRVWA